MSDSEVHFRFLRQPKTVSIVGVPLGFGQPLQGVDRGPLELRQLGLRERLAREGWIVNDLGDIAVADPPKDAEATDRISAEGMYVKWPRAIGKVNQDTAEAVAAAAENRDFVLTLGGDHSIAIGSIAGTFATKVSLSSRPASPRAPVMIAVAEKREKSCGLAPDWTGSWDNRGRIFLFSTLSVEI